MSKKKTKHCCKGDQWQEKQKYIFVEYASGHAQNGLDDILLGKVHNWKSTCLVDTIWVLDFRNKKSLIGICRRKGWLVLVSKSRTVFCNPYLTVRKNIQSMKYIWSIHCPYHRQNRTVATVRQYWGSYSEYKQNTLGLHQLFFS